MDSTAYPAIPKAVWAYVKDLQAMNASHPLLEAIGRQGEQQTWTRIDELFRITSETTRLRPENLLRRLGFDKKNLDPSYLQSIFGIMRDINTLHNIGFVNIVPLPPHKFRRESDLMGDFAGERFAVEVFRSIETKHRFPGHKVPKHNLEKYVAYRYMEKRSQLDSTIINHKCSKALLAVVVDSQPAKALMDNEDWATFTRETYELMGSPANTHLLIFTGTKNLSTGKDECAIYPSLT
jgi:hypothetical protein